MSLKKDEIDDLILKLHVNERPEVYARTVNPTKPMEVIKQLINLGHEAVPQLLVELKNYRKEGEAHYFAEYIVEVLGEIGDPRALDELIKIMDVDFNMDIHEIAISAIAQLGDIAISYYLEEVSRPKSPKVMFDALLIFMHLKKKNLEVLEFAKQILYQNKDYDMRVLAIDVIGKHGTQKEILLLEQYLNEDEDIRDATKNALRCILEDNQAKLKEILTVHGIIGDARCDEIGRKLNLEFRSLGYRYRPTEKLQGQGSDELNEAVGTYFSTKAISSALYEIEKFAIDEGIFSDVESTKILDVWRSLRGKENDLIEKYSSAIALYDYDTRKNLNTLIDERHSYRDLYPVSNDVRTKIKDWISSQNFEVNETTIDFFIHENYMIIARGSGNKNCIILFSKTESKRKYGDVRLRLIGDDWAQKEIVRFKNEFWSLFNDLKDLN